MVESMTKLYSVSEIAEKYGLTPKAVRELCNSRGQKFAFKLKEKGRFYINGKNFRAYLERKRREG